MMAVFWGMLGASAAVGLEVIYRTSGKSWVELIPITIAMQLVISRAIWGIVTTDGILAVSIFFSLGTAVMRLFANQYTGDVTSVGTRIAFGLVLIAVSIKIGERLLTEGFK